MEPPRLKYIYSGELAVAATFESEIQEEVDACFPITVLIYIEAGNKHFRSETHEESFPEGSYILIRKFTEGILSKSLAEKHSFTRSYAFALTDEYLRRIIRQFNIPQDLPPISKRVVRLEKNELLEKLMRFVKRNIENEQDIDSLTLNEKTKEALTAIIKADPGLAAVFREYTLAQRIDLGEFMNKSYLLKMPLKVLAAQSGRSLSTFQRDFKMLFGETPHRWIMRKRLSFARNMLINKQGSPSEIYMQAGFEDLAHFSRAFKRQFGYPPSRIPNED